MNLFFRKSRRDERVSHLGDNPGTTTERSFRLQVWDQVSSARASSCLHQQGRELRLGWGGQARSHGGVAEEHGAHREEKQEPSQKFGLWFPSKGPWIPNSGVRILCCRQCCFENVNGEQIKLLLLAAAWWFSLFLLKVTLYGRTEHHYQLQALWFSQVSICRVIRNEIGPETTMPYLARMSLLLS